MIDIAGVELSPEERETLKDPRVGGVILFSRNYSDLEQLGALLTSLHGLRDQHLPPLIVAIDQEGGRIQRFREGFTRLPPARWLGQRFDEDPVQGRQLASLCGWIMAAELRDSGLDFSFAPVLDLDWGNSDVIGDRAFHRSPNAVGSLASAYVHGMRRAGMAAVVKHFPGHGAVTPDSHAELPVDQRGYDEIMTDMLPYRSAVEVGVQGVMTAHIRYPRIDPEVASFSHYWLQSELRGNIGFAGAIFSDDLSMVAAEVAGSMPERVHSALQSGADMVLICNDPAAVADTLEELTPVDNPVATARLGTLRPAPLPWEAGTLRQSSGWKRATGELEAALAASPLPVPDDA